MTHVAVFTLGKLHLQAGEHCLASFPTRQVEELFAYLLLYPDVAHSREKLIELLWPFEEGNGSRGRFSTVLWRLRSSLDMLGSLADDCLSVTRTTVTLKRQPFLEVDFVAFEQALRRANRAESSDLIEANLRCALELYLGDLFEGIYADWCLLERERFARLYLRGMGQLMAHLIQRQAYEEAIVLGERILQRDGLREEVHRALMYCHWQMQDWSAAALQFQHCAQLLQDELHVAPMPETVALYQQILADRVHHMPPAAASNPLRREQVMQALEEFQIAAAKLHDLLSQNENTLSTPF